MAVQQLPGVLDIHVHLRDPGAVEKEDFSSAGQAAICGGIVFMIDMPNNPIPTITPERLEEKKKRASRLSVCPIGFHYGTDGNNCRSFQDIWDSPYIFGLKLYCNQTTGSLLVNDKKTVSQIFDAWQSEKPILVHALGEELAYVLDVAKKTNRRIHVCHVHSEDALTCIRHAKRQYDRISAGVTPHHLFLTVADEQRLGSFARMLPPLGSVKDKEALWEGLLDGTIDLVESDHAPHTREEKLSAKPPFGVPGLETTLGLLLLSVHERRITLGQLIQWTYDTPSRLFHIPVSSHTFIELDPDEPYIAGEHGYKTKCGWSPFDGWQLYGRVQQVTIHGKQLI